MSGERAVSAQGKVSMSCRGQSAAVSNKEAVGLQQDEQWYKAL
jgi:hypothetical protein